MALILTLVVALEVLSAIVSTRLGYAVGARALGESALLVIRRLVYIAALVAAGVAP